MDDGKKLVDTAASALAQLDAAINRYRDGLAHLGVMSDRFRESLELVGVAKGMLETTQTPASPPSSQVPNNKDYHG